MRISVYSAAFLVILTASSQVFGLNIARNFSGGAAPGNAAGGGTLSDVFDTAADWWEMAILDDHDVTISFSWAPLNSLAQATVYAPIPFRKASVKFDNDGSTNWFVDSTPHDEREWTTFTESVADLGGGPINVQRNYTGPTGDAVGRYDLLTVAKHEIGHALGIINFPTALHDPTVTTEPRPNPGTQIYTTTAGGGHIDSAHHPDAVMNPTVPVGQRKLQTGIDILLAAERSGFTNIVLDPVHLPEPILIDLDIKPGSDPNSVNLKSEGVLPVAILSTDDFNVSVIDVETLRFGDPLLLDNGGMAVSPLLYAFEDVSDDGLLDLTLKFSLPELVEYDALGPNSIAGLLTGELLNGNRIEGTDSIRIVPPTGSNGTSGADGNSDHVNAIPEPSTFILAAFGLFAASVFARKRRLLR